MGIEKVVKESNKTRLRLEQNVEVRDGEIEALRTQLDFMQGELSRKNYDIKKVQHRLELKEKQVKSFEQELKSLRQAVRNEDDDQGKFLDSLEER